MGLLDSVLGAAANAVLNNNNQQGANNNALGGLGGMLGSLLGGQQGGAAGGLAGLTALLPVVTGLLSNDGQAGGLGGLIGKFQQAGLGDAVNSWVGTGENQAVSGDQVTQALGSDTISQIAAQLGVDPSTASGTLAQALPALINQLTPNGQAPAGGLGSTTDLMGMLGGLLGGNKPAA